MNKHVEGMIDRCNLTNKNMNYDSMFIPSFIQI